MILRFPLPMGFPAEDVLAWAGWFIITVGCWCWAISSKPNALLLIPVFAVEVLWLLGSILLLSIGRPHLTDAGAHFAIIGAMAVAAFFALELKGLAHEQQDTVPC